MRTFHAENLSNQSRKNANEKIDKLGKKIKNFQLDGNNLFILDDLEEKLQTAIKDRLGHSNCKESILNSLTDCDDSANVSGALKQCFSALISQIRDKNDRPFINDKAREDHIVDFYRQIYAKSDNPIKI